MKRRMILTREGNFVWSYLQENGEIIEMHKTPWTQVPGDSFLRGSVYIGRVERISDHLEAAFIRIGSEIGYYDMGEVPYAIFTKKGGKKDLSVGDELLVQVTKEADKEKLFSVTSKITLRGQLCVLTYGKGEIGVSAKLPKAKRQALKEVLAPYRNRELGILVRTKGGLVEFADLKREIDRLWVQFQEWQDMALYRTCFSCIWEAPKAYLADIRNLDSIGFDEIVTDNRELYQQVYGFLGAELPECLGKLRFYEDGLPMGSLYSLEAVKRKASAERVWLKIGGYLVVQPTEAMTVIDVNSGKSVAGREKETAVFAMNRQAAEEVARQVRLRNLSGIILVDFINMERKDQRQALLTYLRSLVAQDPVPTEVVDMTRLQLVEMTRKKTRKNRL